MTRDRPVSIRPQAGTWPDDTTSTPCKRGCCWTPGYGHSAAATNCKCHPLPKGTQ